MYRKFEQMLNAMVQNEVRQGDDFIDCCLRAGISPADAGELLERQLGIEADELPSILLK